MKYIILGLVTGLVIGVGAVWIKSLGPEHTVWIALLGYLCGNIQGAILSKWTHK